MNSLKELTTKNYDLQVPFTNKTIFWDTFARNTTPKYRNIPVNQKIDAMKVTGISIENVSVVKELEEINSFNKTNINHEATKFASNSKTCSKSSKRIRNTDSKNHKKINQNHSDSVHSLLDRLGQGSWSEPNLPVAKDRGDTTALQNIYKKRTNTFQNSFKNYLDKRKSISSIKQVVKGRLYIKKGGTVYKSTIEAKKVQVHGRDISPMSKNMLDRNMFETKNLKSQENEDSGFDVAIYLSGFMITEEKYGKQHMMEYERIQRDESKFQNERLKKKNSHPSKKNIPYGKSYDTMKQAHTNLSKLQKAKKCDTGISSRFKTRLIYKINKPNVVLDPSADDSDTEYELAESGAIISKKKSKDILDSHSNGVRNLVKPSESGILSYRSRKSSMSSRSKVVSQSSFSRYSDVYGIPKPKVTEEEMWENFEMIFKSYASTSRHSGEVIPRRISTEWMINAGVVDELMTQRQADDAFRSVAGAKITMNAQEYKNFLICLSLKMKLPYYEIYRRMCGI